MSVTAVAAEIEITLSATDWDWECLWVDDGSEDGTAEMLMELHERDPRHEFVCLTDHAGQSAALLAGFDRARGGIIVTLDGDGQFDPADVVHLVSLLQQSDVDFVCGVRVIRQDSRRRRVVTWLGNRIRNRLFRENFSDIGCPLRAFRRQCLLHLPRFRGAHRFLPAILRSYGYSCMQVPIRHRPRNAGRSKYGFANRFAPFLVDIIGMAWLARRQVRLAVRTSSIEEPSVAMLREE